MTPILILNCVAVVAIDAASKIVEDAAVNDAKLLHQGYSCLPKRLNFGPMRNGEELRRWAQICENITCKAGIIEYERICNGTNAEVCGANGVLRDNCATSADWYSSEEIAAPGHDDIGDDLDVLVDH